jgi:hypothetical protein
MGSYAHQRRGRIGPLKFLSAAGRLWALTNSTGVFVPGGYYFRLIPEPSEQVFETVGVRFCAELIGISPKYIDELAGRVEKFATFASYGRIRPFHTKNEGVIQLLAQVW